MRSWRRLAFDVSRRAEEPLITSLHERGTLGLEVTDQGLFAWFSLGIDHSALVRDVLQDLGPLAPEVSFRKAEEVSDGRWQEQWIEGLEPFPVGRRFLIVPGEKTLPASGERMSLKLTPGRAFGTGEHDTTRGCLELLEEIVKPGNSLLDVGTGSGILAIGARKLGAGRVVAIDFDHDAVKVAVGNAGLNETEGISFAVCDAESLRPHPFDILTANLHSSLLMKVLPLFGAFGPQKMLLSGILKTQADEIDNVSRSIGYVVQRRLSDTHRKEQAHTDEWITLYLVPEK